MKGGFSTSIWREGGMPAFFLRGLDRVSSHRFSFITCGIFVFPGNRHNLPDQRAMRVTHDDGSAHYSAWAEVGKHNVDTADISECEYSYHADIPV